MKPCIMLTYMRHEPGNTVRVPQFPKHADHRKNIQRKLRQINIQTKLHQNNK